FGARAGGLVGAMTAALSKRAVVPMIGGGSQRLFVTHDQQLCELIAAVVAGLVQADRPLFAAHEAPTTLRQIAVEIARARGRRPTTIPLPAWPAYLALRGAELAGARLAFRSDSLLSLMNPIPLDQ